MLLSLSLLIRVKLTHMLKCVSMPRLEFRSRPGFLPCLRLLCFSVPPRLLLVVLTLSSLFAVPHAASDSRDSLNSPNSLPVCDAPGACVVDRTPHAGAKPTPHYRSLRIARNVAAAAAKSLKVVESTQRVEGAAIAEAAQRHLVAELAPQFAGVEAIPGAPLPHLDVPLGQVTLHPRPLDPAPAGSRQSVWIDVLVDGTFCRSVVVPFRVLLQQRVQVAIRDLPAGTLVSNEDFEARTMDVSEDSRRILPASALQGTMRVGTRIGAGDVVQRHQLIDATTLQRGDVVKLMLAASGVTVETRAVAQQNAVLGQEVKVKPDHSPDTVSGRVIAAGVVRVEAW